MAPRQAALHSPHMRQVVPRNPVSQTEEERANVAGPGAGLSEPSITCLAAHLSGSALAVVASTPDASGAGAVCHTWEGLRSEFMGICRSQGVGCWPLLQTAAALVQCPGEQAAGDSVGQTP